MKPAAFDAYTVGQVLGAVSARLESKVTTPPDRYSEATLIEDMLNAHKFGADEAERSILRSTEGLGTARTRAPTVEALLRKGYLTRVRSGKSHQLQSTPIGQAIVSQVPSYLTSVALTAKWEMAFGMIEKGEVPAQAVMDKLHDMLHGITDEARGLHASGSAKANFAVAASAPKPQAGKGRPVGKGMVRG